MANDDQITEIEVLQSIYEGDGCFNQVNDTTFQYKFGEDGEKTSFLLEMQWPPDYPQVVPTFNLNAFYNNHISSSAKAIMITALAEKAEKNVGDPQGYTIFEWARYSMPDIMSAIPTEPAVNLLSLNINDDDDDDDAASKQQDSNQSSDPKSKQRKEQLTKSQKRREWNRLDNKGEKIRGNDWIDVIRHLSQTGPSSSNESTPYTVPIPISADQESD